MQICLRCVSFLIAIACCCSCGSVERSGVEGSKSVLEDNEKILGEQIKILNQVRLVTERREFKIHVPRNLVTLFDVQELDGVLPSELYDLLSKSESENIIARSFEEFLDYAESSRRIAISDRRMCASSAGAQEGEVGRKIFSQSLIRERVARRLDAVVRVRVVFCEDPGTAGINSPVASQPTETNIIRMYQRGMAGQRVAMDSSTHIDEAEVGPLMLGQSFYFEQTADKDIQVGEFLEEVSGSVFMDINQVFDDLGFPPGPVNMIFDRLLTSISREQLATTRPGWFNAISERDKIYISPTIVRAALIQCRNISKASQSYIEDLRFVQKQLKDRRISQGDSQKSFRVAALNRNEFVGCIKDSLTFVVAHEIAHVRLIPGKHASEAEADCAGAAISRHLKRSLLGIFGPLVFKNSSGPDADILGSSEDGLRELQCRRNAPWFSTSFNQSNLVETVSNCINVSLPCEAS